MRRACFALAGLVAVSLGVLGFPGISQAEPISSTDLWDISQGSVVDGTSGALYYRSSYRSDVRDMFGGAFGNIEGGNTVFKDYMNPGFQGGSVPAGFVHYVEWHTPSAVTLRSFSLNAYNEGMLRRAFSRFTLYSGSGAGGPWTPIYDTGAGFTYGPGQLDLSMNVTPLVAQYFRAEFVQASWTDAAAVGPRIQELDGYDTFLPGTDPVVPEPSILVAILSLVGLGLARLAWRRRRKVL